MNRQLTSTRNTTLSTGSGQATGVTDSYTTMSMYDADGNRTKVV